VNRFLTGSESPEEYLDELNRTAGRYNGFNLILGERDRFFWFSNRGKDPLELSPGLYGLSNRLLDTDWPKVSLCKSRLEHLLSGGTDLSPEALFRMLGDRTVADDARLPETGVSLEWERILSPVFIESPTYGTRSSTLLFIDQGDRVTFLERSFLQGSNGASTLKFEFDIEP
ncbi:MAG: NRDE family protein, partial [Pseudomonadota bacterium]